MVMLTMLLTLFVGYGLAEKDPNAKADPISFAKGDAIDPVRTIININNWTYWVYASGKSGNDPDGNSGGIFPSGTAGVVYEDGLVWGALINDKVQVGGSTYRTGSDKISDRIYRIRADWEDLKKNPDLAIADARDFFRTKEPSTAQLASLIEQYEKDWNEWPTDLGAPYVDVDSNGTYDPAPAGKDYPGIAKADQVVWFKYSDADTALTLNFAGSNPMGLEVAVTIWGYDQKTTPLGQVIFKKYNMKNIGQNTMDSMYVAQWCDPDVGQYANDLVGNEPGLGLGYSYNGPEQDSDFQSLGFAPSAFGYDFFQGPLVDGVAGQDLNKNGVDDAVDTGIFGLEKTAPGKINLPMTSFSYFSAGNSEWSDPTLGNYDGSLEWYNLLRGFISLTDVDNPTPFTVRATGTPTKFPLDGDPIKNTGDLDGEGANFPAADRRFALCSGPFKMLPGDEQEIVVAAVGGQGGELKLNGSKLAGLADLFRNDDIAQQTFNGLFKDIPKPPAKPNVSIVTTENSIALNWGLDAASVSATEDEIAAGYVFEGYNIYQLESPTSSLASAKLLATYDLNNGVTQILETRVLPQFGNRGYEIPIQSGTDSGVKRYIVLEKDAFTNEALYPGNTYYFAVTAYNYKASSIVVKTLESSPVVFTVVPQSAEPGLDLEADIGSVVSNVKHDGPSDGGAQVTVVDPTAVTGDDYEVFFEVDTVTGSPTNGELLWGVKNVTKNEVYFKGQKEIAQVGDADDQPIFDGLQVKVTGPAFTFKSVQMVANGAGALDPVESAAAPWQGFPVPDGPAGNGRPTSGQQVGSGLWMLHTGDTAPTGSRGSWDAFVSRSLRAGWSRVIPYDWEMRFTAKGGWAVRAFEDAKLLKVPFELWNVGVNTPNDASDDYRLIPWFLSSGGVGGAQTDPNGLTYQLDPNDHAGSGGTNDPYTPWVYWREPADNSPGTAGYDAFITAIDTTDPSGNAGYTYDGFEIFARTVLMSWNADDVSDGVVEPGTQMVPETGSVLRIVTTKPNTVADKFSFKAPTATVNASLEEKDVNKVNVFPNPYYTGHQEEESQFGQYVQFVHISKKATIRIFNLAGEQVRKLEKDDDSQFFKWDLRNENDLPVASGMYVAHIEMTLSNGKKVTKSLKLAIIQSKQQVEYF